MKIKLVELIEANKILTTIFNNPLEFKLSYRLVKLNRKINEEIIDYEKARNDLVIKKYGVKVEKGPGYTVPKERIEEFAAELDPILDKEIELNIDLIPFELLEQSNIPIASNDILKIEKFIAEKKIEKKVEKTEEKKDGDKK